MGNVDWLHSGNWRVVVGGGYEAERVLAVIVDRIHGISLISVNMYLYSRTSISAPNVNIHDIPFHDQDIMSFSETSLSE